MKQILTVILSLVACTATAQTGPKNLGPVLLVGSVNGGGTNNITNVASVGTAGTTVYYGNGAALTGISGGGGGIAGTNGYSLLQTLAVPTLTNATFYPTNTLSTALAVTNGSSLNGLTLDMLGTTNNETLRLFMVGAERWDVGIRDATNNSFTIHDVQAGTYALRVSNLTDVVVVKSNLWVGGTSLFLPTGGAIYAGGSQLVMSYGTGNFFAGPSAGNFTNSGFGLNVGIGNSVMSLLSTGHSDTAVGNSALAVLTSGNYNTAIGQNALASVVSGGANTAVGTGSLASLAVGSGNVGIGYTAGNSITTGSGNIDIANTGTVGDNDITRIGTPGTHTNAFIAGNLTEYGTITATGVGPVMLTLTNTFSPSDNALQIQGNGSGFDAIQFALQGTNYWQLRATNNEIYFADTNGTRVLSMTNLTDSVGIHGNANFDSNVVVRSNVTWGVSSSSLNANGTITQLSGGAGNSFDSGMVTTDGDGTLTAVLYSGNAALLTGLNASAMNVGTVPVLRLPATLQPLTTNNGIGITNVTAQNLVTGATVTNLNFASYCIFATGFTNAQLGGGGTYYSYTFSNQIPVGGALVLWTNSAWFAATNTGAYVRAEIAQCCPTNIGQAFSTYAGTNLFAATVEPQSGTPATTLGASPAFSAGQGGTCTFTSTNGTQAASWVATGNSTNVINIYGTIYVSLVH